MNIKINIYILDKIVIILGIKVIFNILFYKLNLAKDY